MMMNTEYSKPVKCRATDKKFRFEYSATKTFLDV